MNGFIIGVVAMIVISLGAVFVLDAGFDFSATTVYQSENGSVRLD